MKNQHISFLISDMGAGGAQRVTSILCNHWIKNNNTVTLITFEKDEAKSFHTLHDDIEYIKLCCLSGSASVKDALIANTKRVNAVRRKLTDTRPDILVAFMPENNIIATLATIGIRNFPVVISERSDPNHLPESQIWRALRRLIYPFADTLICQTPKSAQYFDHIVNCRILYNPVSKPYTHTPTDRISTQKFIGALGRLGPEKGFDLLLRAFAQIAHKHWDTDLVIIGEGNSRTDLEALIRSLNIQDRVHLIGQLTAPFTLLKQASAFVMPSRYEGFPNALCEAMVCGLPVIASRNAAQSIPLMKDGTNICLFETENIVQLSQKIDFILSNPQYANRLGKEATEISVDLSPDHICKQWDKNLESIIKQYRKI
jgi:glycosyltransferase involved in cell wall biosynthesis